MLHPRQKNAPKLAERSHEETKMKVAVLIICYGLSTSATMATADEASQGSPMQVVHAYLEEVELTRIVGTYAGGDNTAMTKSNAAKFRAAIASARGNQDLVGAIKAVRGAELAFAEHASKETRSDLDKAVGAAKVELELAQDSGTQMPSAEQRAAVGGHQESKGVDAEQWGYKRCDLVSQESRAPCMAAHARLGIASDRTLTTGGE